MILNSDDIAKRLEGEGPADEQIEIAPLPDLRILRENISASVDLRLGTWFLTARTSRATHFDVYDKSDKPEHHFARKAYVPLGKPFILHPNEFVLAATLEWIKMPKGLAGYVTGKSSWGRRGLVIETAPGVHPGYTGCLTLEVANVGQIPITIMPGTDVCQLFLHKVERSAATAASGSYSCRRQPSLGSIKLSPLIRKLTQELEGNGKGN